MFETLRSDPDASNWLVISLLCFWLRYPEAIGAGSATVPERLARAVRRFTRYGYGLNEQGLSPIRKALRTFESNECIGKAVDDRHLFVHQYREEPEWTILGPEARLREPGEDEDPLASEVRRIEEATDLDRYAARKIGELSRSLGPIQLFREQIFHIFLDRLEKRAPTS